MTDTQTTIPIFQIDAFTDQLFSGNPAAVCPLQQHLSDEAMQAIAAENNLSETAFLLKESTGSYQIRWFTPTTEVNLCGHATLASAYVVLNSLEPELEQVHFSSRSGLLTVSRDGQKLVMNFPAVPTERVTDLPPALLPSLGLSEAEVYRGDEDFIVVVANQQAVTDITPDMQQLSGVEDCRGTIVTAPGDDCDFVSRFFGPQCGVPEDPVTGSAHCALATLWANKLNQKDFAARQLSQRGGELQVSLKNERVTLTGQCAAYLKGEIVVSNGSAL